MMPTVLIGTRKGLFSLDDLWGPPKVVEQWFAGVPVPAVMRDPHDGAYYAAVDHGHFDGKLHRSMNRGKTWEEIAAPTYPPKPDDVEDICPMRRTPRPWSTRLIWSLEPAHADDPGALWCGTIPGGLFRSIDRGASWSLNRPLWDDPARAESFGGGYDEPGIHSISIDPRGAGGITVGISCGGAWHTADNGESWELSTGMVADFMPPGRIDDPRIQDPHRIVRCPGAPDVLWTQHHNGIFRSVDNGRTWGRITGVQPSEFGFAVAVHPTDPDTAWFVPMLSDEVRIPVGGKLVVTRTKDGGKTFEQLTAGLPQEHAYHLVYRHCLDVSSDGQRLVMGSTTGSIWVSHNGGTTWRLATADLPPVLSVRFIA